MRLVRVLIKNSGRYVTYETLIQEAWGGTVVSRHTVASTIAAVRKAMREYGTWLIYRPRLGYSLSIPRSEDLMRTGSHFASRRTRDGFERGLECFQQVALQDPGNARALDEIAHSYLMLGTYGMRAPAEMYSAFRGALARAVGLRGWTPAMRADHGRALHLFEHKYREAEEGLKTAQRQDPSLIPVCLNLAMFYASVKRFDEAKEILADAYSHDPLFPTLPATEIFVLFCRREFDAAARAGKKGLELHPYLHLGRSYYAQALECGGKLEEALSEYRLAAVISPDILWLRALEARCAAKLGRREEALRIWEELEHIRLAEYVDAYHMALLADTLGKREAALEELERAAEENSATLYMIDVDPKMDQLRNEPRFLRLRNALFQNL
jgi:tetratricopeptide (TPR) repeat protein